MQDTISGTRQGQEKPTKNPCSFGANILMERQTTCTESKRTEWYGRWWLLWKHEVRGTERKVVLAGGGREGPLASVRRGHLSRDLTQWARRWAGAEPSRQEEHSWKGSGRRLACRVWGERRGPVWLEGKEQGPREVGHEVTKSERNGGGGAQHRPQKDFSFQAREMRKTQKDLSI